jgi:maltose O-acetyltransferase
MLSFLWRNRERPPVFSRSWLKAWAKRILNSPALAADSLRLLRLRAQGARIGAGTVFAPVKIGGCSRLSVGENTFIGRVQMQAHASITIGSHVCLNDGVRLITASHDVRDLAWPVVSSPIIIRDFAWIATGATILPGVTIGRGAVVGACAVVVSDVPDYAVAAGNPARIQENIRPQALDYNPVRSIALYDAWLGKPKNPVPRS